MLHFGLFDIRTDVFILLVSIILVLLQVFLCFKVKKKSVRLMPVYLTLLLAVVFFVIGFILDGWDSVGFFFLSVCSMILLVCSGIGWGVWEIIKKLKN